MNEPIHMKLKLKYRTASSGRVKNGLYRSRTGPQCCNAGCPSGKKKNQKVKNVRAAIG